MIRPALTAAAVSAALTLVACGGQDAAPPTERVEDTAAPSTSTVLSTAVVTVTEEVTAENTESATSETTTAAPAGPSVEERCELDRLTSDLGVPELDVALYCDGEWAKIGKDRTDWIVRMHWDGTRWIQPEFDGEKRMGLTQGCYLRESFDDIGLPPEELTTPYCEAGDLIY